MSMVRTVLIGLCSLLLAACAPVQRGYDAALLLADLRAQGGDSLLKQHSAPPTVTSFSYVMDGRPQDADLYQGAASPRGTLVLIHGFTPEGRRDARLVGFAQSLARSGFTVLAPELPGFTDMTLGSKERQDIATALRYASRDGETTGLAALSLAAGAAIGAALEPDLADRVSYLALIGPYYDLADVIRYATTGVDAGSGTQREVSAAMRQGRWLILRSQLHHLESETDRRALDRIASLHMREEDTPIEGEVAALGAEGRALLALITNDDPQRVEELLARLPASMRAEMQALDIARMRLEGLNARLLLIHGAEDPVIPASHSRRLQLAVGEQAALFVPPGLDHVELGAGLRDAWELWRAATTLLRLAETGGR